MLDFLVAGACAAARQAEYKLSPDRCLNEGILRTLAARVKAFPVLCEVGAEEPLFQKSKKQSYVEAGLGRDTQSMVLLNDQLPRNLMLAEDAEHPDLWRVEWFDSHGRAYITVFAGPSASERACDYRDAIKDGRLTSHVAPFAS